MSSPRAAVSTSSRLISHLKNSSLQVLATSLCLKEGYMAATSMENTIGLFISDERLLNISKAEHISSESCIHYAMRANF